MSSPRTATTTPALEISGLGVAYDATPVLAGVDLVIPPGVVHGVVGPNGAGKSSLIGAVLGLIRPLAGTVRLLGSPLAAVRPEVAYVPQSARVDWDFPVTAEDMARMGTYGRLGWWRRAGRAERDRAREALERTGMAAEARRPLGELSGGQRQRVLVARALAQEPRLLVLDEPFQGVDAVSQRAITGVLQELRDAGCTVLIVHHDLLGVPELCDEVTLLNRRVIASGPVAEVFTQEAIARTYEIADPAEVGPPTEAAR